MGDVKLKSPGLQGFKNDVDQEHPLFIILPMQKTKKKVADPDPLLCSLKMSRVFIDTWQSNEFCSKLVGCAEKVVE